MIRLLSIAFLFLAITGMAQEKTISNSEAKNRFDGLNTENGKLFYTAHYGAAQPDTPYNIVVKLINDQFETIKKDRIKVKYNAQLQDVTAHKGGLVFYFKSRGNGVAVYYDENGNKVWQKREEKDKNRYNEVKLKSLGEDGIAIVQHHKGDNKGFKLRVRDDDWTEKWEKGVYPEKGKLRFEKVDAAGGKVSVLARYKGGFLSGESGYRLTTFDAKKEALLYSKAVSDDSDLCHPARLKAFGDGTSLLAYYNIPDNEVPNNLNFLKLGSDGSEAFHTNLSYRDSISPANAIHPRPVNSAFQKEALPYVYFHEIQKSGNGIRLVGETYYYNDHGGRETQISSDGARTKKPPKDVLIMDYVTFDLAGNGSLNDIHRQKKPYKKIRAKEFFSKDPIYTGEKLEHFNFLGYHSSNRQPGEPIVTYGWHHNMKYVGYSMPEDEHEAILDRYYTGETVVEPGKGRGALTTYRFEVEGSLDKALYRQYNNVIPYHEKGKMAYYQFNRTSGDLTIKVLDQNDPVTEKPESGRRQLKNVPASGFNGIQAFQNGGYYTWYHSEYGKKNTAYYVFHAFNESLETTGRSLIRVPAGAQPAAIKKSGNYLYMAFQDARNREWHFYRMNKQGVIEQNGQMALNESANKVVAGDPKLQPQSDGALTMIQPYYDTARKRKGLDVIALAPGFSVNWVDELYAPQDNTFGLMAANANENQLGVINAEAPSGSHEDQVHYLTAWNLNNGKKAFRKKLEQKEGFGYPEYLRFNQANELWVSGLYFKGSGFDDQNSDGYFLKAFDENGQEKVNKVGKWEDMEQFLGQDANTDFLFKGNQKVLIQDVVEREDGGFRIIGELFQKSSGATGLGVFLEGGLGDRAFTVLDFVVLEFSKDGTPKDFYRIDKTEQSIMLPDYIEHQRGLSLSYMLRDHEIFSYRGVYKGDSEDQIIYQVKAEKSAPEKVYQQALSPDSKPVSAVSEVKIPEPEDEEAEMGGIMKDLEEFEKQVQEFEEKLEKVDRKINKALKGTNRTFRFSRNQYKGISIAGPNEIVAYQYDPQNYKVYLELKDLK